MDRHTPEVNTKLSYFNPRIVSLLWTMHRYTVAFMQHLQTQAQFLRLLRLRFGRELSRYKSQAIGVAMATSSKIPLLPMEGRKGRLHPLLSSAGSRLYTVSGVEFLTQTGIPSLTHLGITRGPEQSFLLPLLGPPAAHCFSSTPLERFSFSLPLNDMTLINSINGFSTL